jgi:hypothetical protein
MLRGSIAELANESDIRPRNLASNLFQSFLILPVSGLNLHFFLLKIFDLAVSLSLLNTHQIWIQMEHKQN